MGVRILTVVAALALVASACGSRADTEQVVGERAGNPSASDDPAAGDSGAGGDTPSDAPDQPTASDGDATVTPQGQGGGETSPSGNGDGAGSTDASDTSTGGSSGGSTAGSGGNSGAAAASTTASPAPAGVYAYDTDGTSTFGANTSELPEETSLDVKPPSGTAQTSIRDMRDDEGNGSLTETRLDYRADGVYLLYLKITNQAFGQTRVYEFEPSPAPKVLEAQPAPGDSATFSMTSNDGTLTVETTVSVERQEPVTVAGTTVDTLVVRQHSEISGDAEGTSTLDQWVDAEGRTVKEQGESDLTFGGIPVKSEQTSVLQSLDPS